MYLQGLSLPVFDLSLIALSGYYMTRDGVIYSMKTGKLSKLSGTRTRSGHYYVLNKRTHRADYLVTQARRHPQFAQEVNGAPGVQPAPALAPAQKPGFTFDHMQLGQAGRTKSATEAIKEKGFVLAIVGPTDKFVFSTDPVLHLQRPTAIAEAERIATLKPGTKVVLLQAVASVVVGGARWE